VEGYVLRVVLEIPRHPLVMFFVYIAGVLVERNDPTKTTLIVEDHDEWMARNFYEQGLNPLFTFPCFPTYGGSRRERKQGKAHPNDTNTTLTYVATR
jgi:hypothetical protein